MPPIRPWACLYACFGGWALFLLWSVVLWANHDPSLPLTLTAAIVSALFCGTLGTIGWAGLELLDRRAAARTERLEAAISAAVEATKPIVVVPVPARKLIQPGAADGINPTVMQAVRKLRLRIRESDRGVRQ